MNRLLFSAGAVALAFSAHSALAADMPTRVAKAAPAYVAPMFDWSGFYVGAQAGYSWGDNDYRNLSTGDHHPFDVNGAIAGGHIGAQWQSGSWVLGLEADANWSGAEGDDGGSGGIRDTLDVRWAGSGRLRSGFAFNSSMIYVTGGWAWANVEHSRPGGSFSDTMHGWTVGVGVSVASTPNFIWSLEYRYSDYGDVEGRPINDLVRDELTEHQVTVRASWKFATGKAPAAAPLVTKY
jgi:outer membrane immunogenic protein